MPGAGPEDALFVDDAIYTGLGDGRIVKVSFDGWQIEVVADTGWPPPGAWNSIPTGILICDAEKGLLLLGPGHRGRRRWWPGTVACVQQRGGRGRRHGVLHRLQPAVRPPSTGTKRTSSSIGTGRLLRRDPDGAVEVLVEVCSSRTASRSPNFLAVAQTGLYYAWTAVAQDGTHEPWITNLPPSPTTSPGTTTVWLVTMASAPQACAGQDRRTAVPAQGHLGPAEACTEAGHAGLGALADPGNVVPSSAASTSSSMCTGVRARGGKVAMGSLNTTALAWFEIWAGVRWGSAGDDPIVLPKPHRPARAPSELREPHPTAPGLRDDLAHPADVTYRRSGEGEQAERPLAQGGRGWLLRGPRAVPGVPRDEAEEAHPREVVLQQRQAIIANHQNRSPVTNAVCNG